MAQQGEQSANDKALACVSMTGFARLQQSTSQALLSWELRAVNHRHFDVQLRLPAELTEHEAWMRQQLREQLQRGRIELQLRLQAAPGSAAPRTLNQQQLQWLQDTLAQLQQRFPEGQLQLNELLHWPGLLQSTPWDQQQLRQHLEQGLVDLIAALQQMRQAEGQRLGAVLQQAQLQMQEIVQQLLDKHTDLQALYQQQLVERMAAMQVECEPQRLAQEVALLCQRADIMEEVQRLQSHLQEFAQLLAKPGVVGRRLDFLLQELMREANTLASKAPQLVVTQAALDLKVCIEQCREQVQNIV